MRLLSPLAFTLSSLRGPEVRGHSLVRSRRWPMALGTEPVHRLGSGLGCEVGRWDQTLSSPLRPSHVASLDRDVRQTSSPGVSPGASLHNSLVPIPTTLPRTLSPVSHGTQGSRTIVGSSCDTSGTTRPSALEAQAAFAQQLLLWPHIGAMSSEHRACTHECLCTCSRTCARPVRTRARDTAPSLLHGHTPFTCSWAQTDWLPPPSSAISAPPSPLEPVSPARAAVAGSSFPFALQTSRLSLQPP